MEETVVSEEAIERSRVGIVFGSRPEFDEYAFKYFILQLNKQQALYEFEFPLVENGNQDYLEEIEDYLFPFGPIYNLNEVYRAIRKAKANAKKDELLPGQFAIRGEEPYLIVIVDFPLQDGLFYDASKNIAVITTSEWERQYAPPSLFEYLLQSICAELLLMKPELAGKLEAHDETRGCPFDYTPDKVDYRVDITLVHICDECQKKIKENTSKGYLEKVNRIFSGSWIGRVDSADTVAYNLKRFFKVDLDRDSGFRKSYWEKASDYFPAIPEKIVTPALLALGAALVGYLLGKR